MNDVIKRDVARSFVAVDGAMDRENSADRFSHVDGFQLFVWDGWNIVLEQITFSDDTTRTIEYYWGNDLSGTEQGAGGVGGLLATRIDGVFYVPVYGGNGNIAMYVGENGSISAQYDYDPYGNILQASGPLAQQFAFGFSTKYHDREVDLVAYQLRTYDPVHGRWLNRDPIEEEGGENLYGFCGNCTLADYDILGLKYIEYVTTGGRTVNEIGDVRVTTKKMNHSILKHQPTAWGMFQGYVQSIYRCKIIVRLDIYLHPNLAEDDDGNVAYTYLPHLENGDNGEIGSRSTSGGYHPSPLKGVVNAHEYGHANAFWELRPAFEMDFCAKRIGHRNINSKIKRQRG